MTSKGLPEVNSKHYPYHPLESSYRFPRDEGRHDPIFKYPKEWWYINFHLIGKSTGTRYGAFVAFFKTAPARLFSISDISLQKMYNNIKFGILMTHTDKLDLTFLGPFKRDYFYNKYDGDELVPLQYKLIVSGKSKEEKKEKMELDVDMHCLKPPMVVGNGLVNLGKGWSYYYCETKIKAYGTITVHGTTEPVTGYAWTDHQWGNFNRIFSKNKVNWEWFSIKLDDLREIMVGDIWWPSNKEYCAGYGLNLFNTNHTHEILNNYKITQLNFWEDKKAERDLQAHGE